MMLATTAPCADRFYNLADFCRDPQTPVSDGPRCAGRSAFRAPTSPKHSAECRAVTVVVLTSARKWTAGSLQRAVEAALGGKAAFRARLNAASDRYDMRGHTDADLRALHAAQRTEWVQMRAGSLTFRARISEHRTVIGNTHSAVDVLIPGTVGTSPVWYHMAALANA